MKPAIDTLFTQLHFDDDEARLRNWNFGWRSIIILKYFLHAARLDGTKKAPLIQQFTQVSTIVTTETDSLSYPRLTIKFT